MNRTRNPDHPSPTPEPQPNQKSILTTLLAEGARLRAKRTRRRILTGTGIAASALALTWIALLFSPGSTSHSPIAPGRETTPELATNTRPAANSETNTGTNSGASPSAEPDAAVIASTGNAQTSTNGSVKATSTFTAVWKTAHNQPGGFKTITTDELLTQINTDGKSFGLIELPGTMLLVSNNRSVLNAQ